MKAYRDLFMMMFFCGGLVNCIFSPVWVEAKSSSLREGVIESNVCVDVSMFERFNVIKAIETWNRVTETWQRFSVVDKKLGNNCDLFIQEVEPDFEKPVTVLASTMGLGNGRIKLFRGRYEINSYAVTLHEIGHVLGAKHLRGTLMDAKLDLGVYHCPDVATVLQIANVNGIDPETLSWCQ
jgi:hypothetical protein